MNDFITMLLAGWIMALVGFVAAGGLCWFAFSRLFAKAYDKGVDAGYRKSQNAPPRKMEENFDADMEALSKEMRGVMGQNGELEESDAVTTDDLGYPVERDDLASHDNFRRRNHAESGNGKSGKKGEPAPQAGSGVER